MAFIDAFNAGLGRFQDTLFPVDPNSGVDPATAQALQNRALLTMGLSMMGNANRGFGPAAFGAMSGASQDYTGAMNNAYKHTLLKREADWQQQDRERQAKVQQRDDRQSAAVTAQRVASALQNPTYAANPGAYWDMVKGNQDVQAMLQQSGVPVPQDAQGFQTFGQQLGTFAETSGPASVTPTTDDIKEYGLARQQGFKGSFFDYLKTIKAAGAQQINLPSGYKWNPDGTMSPITGGPADPSMKPPSEADKKAGVLLQGMRDAEGQLSQLAGGADTSSVMNVVKGKLPGGGVLQSDDYRKYKAAADRWASNYLYLKSGAQAGKDEIATTVTQFFPQPGDGPDVITQKNAARAQEAASIAGVYGATPVTAPTAQIIPNSQAAPVRIQSDADHARLPSGAQYIGPDGKIRKKR